MAWRSNGGSADSVKLINALPLRAVPGRRGAVVPRGAEARVEEFAVRVSLLMIQLPGSGPECEACARPGRERIGNTTYRHRGFPLGSADPGDLRSQSFARHLDAERAGDATQSPLRAVDKGGIVVCAAIHMSTIPVFEYRDLWGQRILRSVANLTRADGEAFMALAGRTAIVTTTQPCCAWRRTASRHTRVRPATPQQEPRSRVFPSWWPP